jgi:hypothetical protein
MTQTTHHHGKARFSALPNWIWKRVNYAQQESLQVCKGKGSTFLPPLEKPGKVVRGELRGHLWSDNIFVNFENGSNTATARLRGALW